MVGLADFDDLAVRVGLDLDGLGGTLGFHLEC